jgi:transcriptional regulator GlxA family with amidase domain
MSRIRIGIIGYDGVAAINVVGPLEAFSNAVQFTADSEWNPYQVVIVGCGMDQFVTDTGLTFGSESTRPNDPPFDTIIVPGGRGMRDTQTANRIATWISSQAEKTRRIASVCTGIYALARTGLLNGRRVTIHWQNALDVATQFRTLQVEESAIVLNDGKYYTAAGATAGIDLALFLISEDFGQEVAVRVARKLLVYLHRDGGQEQYSEPVQPKAEVARDQHRPPNRRMTELIRWITSHLGEDLRLENLARQVCLPRHQFIQEFIGTFGVPPGLYVKNLRFHEARRRLSSGESPAAVARAVGFADPPYFIQEFRRRFGMLPAEYQRRFDYVEPGTSDQRQTFTARAKASAAAGSDRVRPQITSFSRCVRRHSPIRSERRNAVVA